MSQASKALASLLQHYNTDPELANDKTINLIVNFQSATDIKSPIRNVSIHKFKNVPIVVSIPNKINKKIRNVEILMITKNPSTFYIEKLRECEALLPKTSIELEKELENKRVYAKSSWRDSPNLKSNIKNLGPKLRTAQEGKAVISNTKDLQATKSQFVDNSDSSELFSKIMSVKQLKSMSKSKEFNNLLKTHEYIIADQRVVPEITKLFPQKSRKQPFMIRLASADSKKRDIEKKKKFAKKHNHLNKMEKAELDSMDLKFVFSQVKSITKNTSCVLPLIATTINKYDKSLKEKSVVDLNFIIGKPNVHSVEEMVQNIEAIVKYINENLLKSGSQIKGMTVKTDNSQSLPIL